MKRDFEYIVLGLGGLGSAATYWLSRDAGGEVLGLEQFPLGHERGGSQDHSRIIRLSYHTPAYVELARQAYEAWSVVEDEAGEELVLKTGGLDLWPRPSAISIDTYTAALAACAVPYEHLEAGEIMRRWPQFRLSDDVHGLYQSQGGIAKAALANAAHRRLASQRGAVLRDNTKVQKISLQGDEVMLSVEGESFRCRQLVIASGAWSNVALNHLGWELPLEVTQEQVTYYATPHLDKFQPDRFPVWIWMDDPSYYGFPVFGAPATKAAQDAGGRPVTAETRSFEPDARNQEQLDAFMARILPEALGPIHSSKTCLYTLTPDRDFVIDAVPHTGNRVWMAIGAGHAFKFSSLIGRALAGLATRGSSGSDLTPFAFERPILKEVNPTRSYMV